MIRLPLVWALIPSLNVPTTRTVWPDSSETCPAANSPKLGRPRQPSASAVSGRPSASRYVLTALEVEHVVLGRHADHADPLERAVVRSSASSRTG